uniref:Uncharacterized protein n=1 Tax=Arion vulgaris TaxID=1028688 RepID=A0A0B6Z2E5_9EUPU
MKIVGLNPDFTVLFTNEFFQRVLDCYCSYGVCSIISASGVPFLQRVANSCRENPIQGSQSLVLKPLLGQTLFLLTET